MMMIMKCGQCPIKSGVSRGKKIPLETKKLLTKQKTGVIINTERTKERKIKNDAGRNDEI